MTWNGSCGQKPKVDLITFHKNFWSKINLKRFQFCDQKFQVKIFSNQSSKILKSDSQSEDVFNSIDKVLTSSKMKIPIFGFSNNFDKNVPISIWNNEFCCYNVGNIVLEWINTCQKFLISDRTFRWQIWFCHWKLSTWRGLRPIKSNGSDKSDQTIHWFSPTVCHQHYGQSMSLEMWKHLY